ALTPQAPNRWRADGMGHLYLARRVQAAQTAARVEVPHLPWLSLYSFNCRNVRKTPHVTALFFSFLRAPKHDDFFRSERNDIPRPRGFHGGRIADRGGGAGGLRHPAARRRRGCRRPR